MCKIGRTARGPVTVLLAVRGLFIVPATILLLASVPWAQGVCVNWGAAGAPIYDEHGVEGGLVLADGSLVQLILDSDDDGIDPPGADGSPSSGDVLLDSSSIGEGSFFKGKFSKNFSTGLLKPGMRVYVRAWNGRSPAHSTHFGNSRLMVVPQGISVTFDATLEGPWATLESFTGVSEVVASASIYGFELLQSFPNPFVKRTRIPFSVPGSSISGEKVRTSLDIYDTSGRLIAALLREDKSPGLHVLLWDGKTDEGGEAPSGVYMCRLRVGERCRTRKLLLLR